MPRKTLTPEERHQILVSAFKWEFLRRRTEYRKDFEAYRDLFDQYGIENLHLSPGRYLHGPFLLEQELCEKWQIGFLGDPNNPYVRRVRKGRKNLFFFYPNPVSSFHKDSPIEIERSADGEPTVVSPRASLSEIADPKKGRHLREVLRERLGESWFLALKMKKEPPQQRSHRARLASYPWFLLTHDLRQKGLSLRAIARRLYPEDYREAERRLRQRSDRKWLDRRDRLFEKLIKEEKTADAATKTVDQKFLELVGQRSYVIERVIYNLKRANELIDGGYAEIS